MQKMNSKLLQLFMAFTIKLDLAMFAYRREAGFHDLPLSSQSISLIYMWIAANIILALRDFQ
jgi:hypothetical protein